MGIYLNQIERYGGRGGEFLQRDIFEMAAAYTFHLCQNHPFINGNKRTALVFLELNGSTFGH